MNANRQSGIISKEILLQISQQYKRDGHSPAVNLCRKFGLMAQLFSNYMSPGCRFLDVGCGEGDCLALARLICPTADLWGIDFCEKSIQVARNCLPGVNFVVDDIRHLNSWLQATFDIVHEFGAAFLVQDWTELARTYLSLVRPGGYVIWELPEAFSMAHFAYLFSPAFSQLNEKKYSWKRILRTFSLNKFTFRSWSSVQRYLSTCGYENRVVERKVLLHYHVRWIYRFFDQIIAMFGGDRAFDLADKVASMVLRPSSGYYVVIQRSV